jgi:hypothetical protein
MIPSLVLLPALYYKGVPNGPSIEFVFSYNRFLTGQKQKPPEQVAWEVLLQDLGIVSIDEFETHLLTFLQTGLFEPDLFRKVVEGYVKSFDQESKDHRLRSFFDDLYWDTKKSDADLLRELAEIATNASTLPFATVTALSNAAEELGDHALAGRMVDARVEELYRWAETNTMEEDELPYRGSREFHPKILEAQEVIRRRKHPPLPIVEVIKRMIKTSGWGNREIESLKATSVASYIQELERLDGSDLATLLQRHITWLAPDSGYQKQEGFAHALKNFLTACRQIAGRPTSSKLRKVVLQTFERAQLSDLLKPEPDETPVGPHS